MTPSVNYQWISLRQREGSNTLAAKKDAEECFSRPHTPILPSIINTHNLCLHTVLLQSITLCFICHVCSLIGSFAFWWDCFRSCLWMGWAQQTAPNELCAAGCWWQSSPFLVLIKQDTFLNSPNPQNAGLLCYLITACLSVWLSVCLSVCLRSFNADLDSTKSHFVNRHNDKKGLPYDHY